MSARFADHVCMCGHLRKQHQQFAKPERCWQCGCGMFHRTSDPKIIANATKPDQAPTTTG